MYENDKERRGTEIRANDTFPRVRRHKEATCQASQTAGTIKQGERKAKTGWAKVKRRQNDKARGNRCNDEEGKANGDT